jgi:hypothetical protein
MSTTTNLGITEISASQTQKEATANTAFDSLDKVVTDLYAVPAITTADVTADVATATFSRRLKLTGALTANRNLILPSTKHEWVIDNQTTGKFKVTVKTASGSGVDTYGTGWGHAAGDVRHVYCDGTNVISGQSSLGGASEATLNLSADTTLPALAGRQNILVDASGGNRAITLPTGTAGMVISVKKTDSSGNSVTVTATIEGATNYVITEQNRVVEVEYDTAWRIRNVYSPSVVTDDDTAYAPLASPDFTTDYGLDGAHGEAWTSGQATELVTLATGATFTDSSANLLPANAIIESVVARVTTTISGVATPTEWKVGDATTTDRFISFDTTLTAGETQVGLNHQQGGVSTNAAGPVQTAAAKVRITLDQIPDAGAVRITVFYRQFVAPTS